MFANRNIFLDNFKNQISFNVGQAVNRLGLVALPKDFAPYTMLHFQYSQSTDFFVYQPENLLILFKQLGMVEMNGIGVIIRYK